MSERIWQIAVSLYGCVNKDLLFFIDFQSNRSLCLDSDSVSVKVRKSVYFNVGLSQLGKIAEKKIKAQLKKQKFRTADEDYIREQLDLEILATEALLASMDLWEMKNRK